MEMLPCAEVYAKKMNPTASPPAGEKPLDPIRKYRD
jgi:hypothetical protein